MSAPWQASLPWDGYYSGSRDVPCLLLPFLLGENMNNFVL